MLENYSGDKVTALNWSEGRSESISIREEIFEWSLNDKEQAKRRCGGGVFWTEITASKNVLKVGCQIWQVKMQNAHLNLNFN